MGVSKQDLVDAEVGVRRDDSAAGEVNALARQVAAEAALLALQPLHKPPARMATIVATCMLAGAAAELQHPINQLGC